VPPELHYPDVATPVGWPYFRQGLQIRLVPPGRNLDDAETMIVISPLVPRQDGLPPPDKLIEAAIFAEARQRFEVVSQKGPAAVASQAGLEGVSYEVLGYVRPRFPREKRIYVMFADPICYYAVSYLATEPAFERDAAIFWKTARSMRPFRGHKLAPSGPSPLATIYSD
jgi:hypothetical protein